MGQCVDAGKTQPKKSIWLFGMVIAVFLIIQFDAAASVISNQILLYGKYAGCLGCRCSCYLDQAEKEKLRKCAL